MTGRADEILKWVAQGTGQTRDGVPDIPTVDDLAQTDLILGWNREAGPEHDECDVQLAGFPILTLTAVRAKWRESRHVATGTVIEWAHDDWKERGCEGEHPLNRMVTTWQNRPATVRAETRRDTRILSTMRAESRPERRRGMLFGGLTEGRQAQAELPLFEAVSPRKTVPILDLADAAGVPVMAQGRGAPLAARLFVRAGLSVEPTDRRRDSVRVALTVRELRNGLFPRGASKWGERDWPRLKDALMGARDYTVRLPDGGRWFMLALRQLPAEDAHGLPGLDDHVVFDLAYPPGATDGPLLDLQTMDALSVESAPRWRAYIAAHALAWDPGKTRRPIPGSGKRHYGWSRNAADYPILTIDDMRRLAFGEADRKNRTHAEIEAPWSDLPGLVVADRSALDPKTGEVGWRIMPAPARGEDDDDGEGTR